METPSPHEQREPYLVISIFVLFLLLLVVSSEALSFSTKYDAEVNAAADAVPVSIRVQCTPSGGYLFYPPYERSVFVSCFPQPATTVNGSATYSGFFPAPGTGYVSMAGTPVASIIDGTAGILSIVRIDRDSPVVFQLWTAIYNSAGQTVGVIWNSFSGQSGTFIDFFIHVHGLPPGEYTAHVFIATTSGIVVSPEYATRPFAVSA